MKGGFDTLCDMIIPFKPFVVRVKHEHIFLLVSSQVREGGTYSEKANDQQKQAYFPIHCFTYFPKLY